MNKFIPFFSIEKQTVNQKKLFLNEIEKVIDTQSFIGGSFVQDFEKNFSKYVNSKFSVSCNSGTDALWLALKAMDLQKNSIVLTTPFSFIASSSEIVAHGAHPVFIDVDKKTYNLDPQKLEQWIKENTIEPFDTPLCGYSSLRQGFNGHAGRTEKSTGYPVAGILSVDIFGQCADYKKIKQIADKYNLWIIEDACQAIGATTPEKQKAGTLGDISCFSFYPTKNLGAFGDGGMCTTNNEVLAEKLLQLRNHGRKSHYNYAQHGINSRLDGIQAAILNTKLKQLDQLNDARIKIAQIYNQKLSNINWIQTPKKTSEKHVYHQYCIKVDNQINRDNLMEQLKTLGIGTNIYYPKALDQIDFLNTDKRLKTECPISKDLTKTILALPIWPELELNNIEYICENITNICPQIQKDYLCQKKVI